jgi:hypothetical protein
MVVASVAVYVVELARMAFGFNVAVKVVGS